MGIRCRLLPITAGLKVVAGHGGGQRLGVHTHRILLGTTGDVAVCADRQPYKVLLIDVTCGAQKSRSPGQSASLADFETPALQSKKVAVMSKAGAVEGMLQRHTA